MQTSIVTTTINIPLLLEKYALNAKFFGHTDLDFIVIGDRKTPSGTDEFCSFIDSNYYPCRYLDMDRQHEYLSRFPRLWSHLPFDSIQRRNIGMLWAYENGADVVITIDDDNWVMNQDFVGSHGYVGQLRELPVIDSTSGWFNVCSLLVEEHGTQFYHRGFPMRPRWNEDHVFTTLSQASKRVAVNAGFWLDDPDIDALARLNRRVVVQGMRDDVPATLGLYPGTWSPFNSQNTALMREAVPAYFLSPCIGRYDDIWAGYIVSRISEHFGDVITFGRPLVRQSRNEHNLWKDLDAERNGMLMTDEFCSTLRALRLRSGSYHTCFGEIASGLANDWKPAETWDESMKQWHKGFLEGLRIWHEVFEEIQTFEHLGRLAVPLQVPA